MKNKTLNKPTIFHIVFGTVITMITEKFYPKSQNIETRIGKYTLVREITKENPFKKYATGIYKKGRTKVFIKTWHGKIHNLHYYSLVNQAIMHSILQQKINTIHANMKIPKLIETIKGEHSLSLVFENIEGINLKKFPIKKQVQILEEIINELEKIYIHLTDKEKKQFMKRSHIFYITTFPIFVFFTCLSNSKYFYVFIKIFIKSLFSVSSFFTKSLVLSHRDLNLENIIQTKQGLYLLDNETVVITHPAFDRSYIEIGPDFQHIPKNEFKNFHHLSDIFLKNYILFQLASDPSNPPQYKKYFLHKLKEVNYNQFT